jgi:hypothetical protein
VGKNQLAAHISLLIYSNYTVLYMFRRNKFIIRKSIVCTRSIYYFHAEITYIKNDVKCLYIYNIIKSM